MSSSSLMRGTGSPLAHAANKQCLSPQDKLKGASSVKASTSLGLVNQQRKKPTDLVDVAAMEIDLDLDLTQDDQDEDMDDAGWISDDNLRALDFDDRLNQDIDWVGPDKLQLFPSASDDDEDDDVVQDFVFDPSSFLSPLRGSLSFDGVASSSFAESLSVDTPPPSFGTSHDAEKLLMSFDTMNFTIPSPTSGSTKKRTSLFGKNDPSTATATDASSAAADSKSSSANEKDGARSPLPKLSIPSPEHLLGVLSITTPTAGGHHASTVDSQKKIGSYSPEARRLRIQKFHEKRKNRTWKKSIKYDCRKKLADDRPRIKGRFVRVLENATDVKEEDTCSTTSTSSTGVSSPRSLGSPLPSALFGAALTISTGEATPVPSPSASPAQPSVIASPSLQPTLTTGVPLAVAVAAVAAAQMPIKIEQPAAAP